MSAAEEITYLGHLVNKDGITPLKVKLDLIKEWPQPRTIKDLRAFLGFVNRYFTFYPHLSTVTAPLARAASKRNLIRTPEMQHSFESTKQAFEKVQTLTVTGPNGEYVLETDASQTGIRACSFQVQDGLEKPIGYFSRSLKDAQKNYGSHKLELFALYQAVKYFAVYLSFLPHFVARTDNQASRFWRTPNSHQLMCAQSGSRTSTHSALIASINPELRTASLMPFLALHNMFRVLRINRFTIGLARRKLLALPPDHR
jgi:hypothetical protein